MTDLTREPSEIMVRQPESVTLTTLADRANAAHREAEGMAYAALEHARQAGKALLEAKEQVSHGEWGDWLRDHFEGSIRSAQQYMRVASNWPELETKYAAAAHLNLRQAVKLLEKPHAKLKEQHPLLRGLLPGVEDSGFPLLLEDIRLHGLHHPIVCDQRGYIIDGWLRYQACCQLGIDASCETVVCDEDKVLDIFISYNFRRAQYTEDQFAMMAARMSDPALCAEPRDLDVYPENDPYGIKALEDATALLARVALNPEVEEFTDAAEGARYWSDCAAIALRIQNLSTSIKVRNLRHMAEAVNAGQACGVIAL